LEHLEREAKDAGIPLSKLAIAWILKNPTVTAPIVGASSVEQVEQNCRLIEINLGDEIYRGLNDLTRNVSVSLYS
jgi:aryl-alcohol dehydrogenase-like predicted oxidoreductase